MEGEEVANGGGKWSRVRKPPHLSARRLVVDSDWHQAETWRDHFINVAVIRSCGRLYHKFTFRPKLRSKRIGSACNLLFCGRNACSVIWKEWARDDTLGDYSVSAQDYTWWISPFPGKVFSILYMLAAILYTSQVIITTTGNVSSHVPIFGWRSWRTVPNATFIKQRLGTQVPHRAHRGALMDPNAGQSRVWSSTVRRVAFARWRSPWPAQSWIYRHYGSLQMKRTEWVWKRSTEDEKPHIAVDWIDKGVFFSPKISNFKSHNKSGPIPPKNSQNSELVTVSGWRTLSTLPGQKLQ